MKNTGKRIQLLDVSFDNLSFGEAVGAICDLAVGPGSSFVVTPNVDHVMKYRRDPEFREVYRKASLVLADGMPVIWASRLLGKRLADKVSGSDLLPAVCAEAAAKGLSVFFVGGKPGAAEACARVVAGHNPSLRIAGTDCPPIGFERRRESNQAVVDKVRSARPDILFVALGTPKQEYWLRDNIEALGVPVALGVGAAVDFMAGAARRAPVWMQRCGLEWFDRLVREPRRMWKRYLVDGAPFPFLVLGQLIGIRRPIRS